MPVSPADWHFFWGLLFTAKGAKVREVGGADFTLRNFAPFAVKELLPDWTPCFEVATFFNLLACACCRT